MVGAKFKIIEETIYEEASKKFAENGIAPSIARLIMKSVQCRFEEQAFAEMSLELLKAEQNQNGGNENDAVPCSNRQ